MSVIRLYAENPTEGSFDQVRFYEATDNIGTGSTLLSTEDVDTTTADVIYPGFTSYLHSSGDTAKFYATTWYNSDSTGETDKSDWVQGGQDRWDTMFMDEMNDTSSAVWSATDRQLYKEHAIEALYPDFFTAKIDTSLVVVNSGSTITRVYTLPNGLFDVFEIGVGDPDSSTQTYKRILNDNWTIERNKLRFYSMSGLTNGYPIRLVAQSKYENAGQVPKRLDFIVMYHMRMSAYTRLADDFPRFDKWSRLQKGTKVSFENLRVHAREFERKFEEEKRRMADTLHQTEMV